MSGFEANAFQQRGGVRDLCSLFRRSLRGIDGGCRSGQRTAYSRDAKTEGKQQTPPIASLNKRWYTRRETAQFHSGFQIKRQYADPHHLRYSRELYSL